MNFTLEPSLEHIALFHVTGTVWNRRDIRDFNSRTFEYENLTLRQKFDRNVFIKNVTNGKQGEWNKMEERVMEKLSQLTIPTTLKEKLFGYVRPVGLQICKWMEYHVKCCSLDLGLQNKFFWTLHGTIDKKKTAEILIKDDAIDITTRYKLACIYCFEDDIPELWYKLSESHKTSFYNEENIENNLQKELLIYWAHYIRERGVSMDNMTGNLNLISFSESYMFQCAAENGNKAATEYFLQKLVQREELLLKSSLDVVKKIREGIPSITCPTNEYFSEVLCFLLSQMNDDQQIKISEECPFLVLKCLLDCPWQNSFVEKVSRLWNFLLGNRYYAVLVLIITKVNAGCKDFNYRKLFRYIWQQIPNSDKSSIIMNNKFYRLLNVLLDNNDRDIIKLVFQDATVDEKNKVMFGDIGQFVWEAMIYHAEWSLLKCVIPLCLSSKDDMITFKQKFEKHIQMRRKWHSSDDIVGHTMNNSGKFFQILDGFIRGYDKKKRSGEGDYSPHKRININLISE